jgi:hypothetical protein
LRIFSGKKYTIKKPSGKGQGWGLSLLLQVLTDGKNGRELEEII